MVGGGVDEGQRKLALVFFMPKKYWKIKTARELRREELSQTLILWREFFGTRWFLYRAAGTFLTTELNGEVRNDVFQSTREAIAFIKSPSREHALRSFNIIAIEDNDTRHPLHKLILNNDEIPF